MKKIVLLPLTIVCMTSLSAQAAIYASAKLDWSKFEVTLVNPAMSFELTPHVATDLYSFFHTRQSVNVLDRAGCYNGGDGCTREYTLPDPDFPDTLSLSASGNTSTTILNQESVAANVNNALLGETRAESYGYSKLRVYGDGPGSIILRLPYEFDAWADADPPGSSNDAFSMVALGVTPRDGHTAPGLEITTEAMGVHAKTAEVYHRTGVLQVSLYAEPGQELGIFYSANSYAASGDIPPIPEPESYALVGMGLLAVAASTRRRARS